MGFDPGQHHRTTVAYHLSLPAAATRSDQDHGFGDADDAHIQAALTKEQTMSDLDTAKSTKPFDHELTEQDLNKVTGGDGKKAGGAKDTDRPAESLSLNFTKVAFTYTE